MPVCPGCERRVQHKRLPVHQRYCSELHGSGGDDPSVSNRVEQYLSDLDERIAEELERQQAEMERRLHQVEDELRAR